MKLKKLLIAIDNEKIYNDIKEKNKYEVCSRDIVYKEGVLEYLSKNNADVIITKDDLDGDMIKEIYIKQIKLLAPNIKVILFAKELETKYLEFLYSNDVFNVIGLNEECNFEKIINMIDSDMPELPNIIENVNKKTTPVNVVTKKKIAVFGTNGAGKSYISTLLTEIIAEKLNMNTLLIDMDVQNSAIDIYNNLNCANNLLMDIVRDINNQTITVESFLNNIYRKGKKSYITNNASIFDYQNNLCIRQYDKIFEIASTQYDVLVSDIPRKYFA